MDKIILRHRKTGETRTVDRAKYEALAPERKALYEIAAEPTTEQLAEARRLAGIGPDAVRPSTAESMLRGAAFGRGFEPATTIGGAAAEAAGAGLRDAVLAGIAARFGGPRLAAAVPTVTGAIEGAVDPSLEGPGERAAGAVIGGLLANVPIPVPKILKNTAGTLKDAAEEAAGKVREKLAAREVAKRTREAEKAAEAMPAGITPETIERLLPQTSSTKRTQSMIAGEIEPPDAETEAIAEAAAKALNLDQTTAAAEAAQKALEAAKAPRTAPAASELAARAGARGSIADLVRQAPQQAIAAIMADPRLEGKQLSDVTPSEMWAALKRAVTLIGDEEQRINELAIQESKR